MKNFSFTTSIIFVVFFIASIASVNAQNLSLSTYINEINYLASNPVERGIEIAGQAGTDVTGWQIVGYNTEGAVKFVEYLENGLIPNSQNGYGTIWYDVDQAGDANGVALVDADGSTIQFISYGIVIITDEIIFASEGPAAGLSSEYIGEQILGAESMQLTGVGVLYGDFLWVVPGESTPDEVNTLQTFLGNSGLSQGETPVQPTTQYIANPKLNTSLNIQLYPNPTVNYIRLEGVQSADIVDIKIVDANGQLVSLTNYSSTDGDELNVQSLPSGQYWLQVLTHDASAVMAFVKK